MFQTEVIHALQSFASEPLTALMVGVTYLGYGATFFVLGVVVMFGVDFRKGFLMVQVLLWNAVLLYLIKNSVALPRPSAVDPAVRLLGGDAPNLEPFERMGAPGFWDRLPEEVVAHHRAGADPSQGFPSGHVSTTVACWGALALLFRKRWLAALGAVLVVLMPLSRMYLGAHFLADVLGGLVLGLVVLGAAWMLVLRRDRLRDYLSLAVVRITQDRRTMLFGTLGLVVPCLLLLVPAVDAEHPARLLGLNAGYLLVARAGVPVWSGGLVRRGLRVLFALALYAGTSFVLQQAGDVLLGRETTAWAFAAEAASIALMVWGGTRKSG